MLKTRYQKLGLLFYYPHGAGGKFIINGLSLSRHCVLFDINFAVWDIEQTKHDASYYQKKLDRVLTSVPEKQDRHRWQNYELGTPPGAWEDENCTHLRPVLEYGMKRFYYVAHYPELAEQYQAQYPDMTMIKLTNYGKWMQTSAFKVPDLERDLANKLAHWRYTDRQESVLNRFKGIKVDIDNNIFDHDNMQQHMKYLYDQLGFDDFQPELWSQYYHRYMQVHEL
jgi:hypothetical protein